MQRISFYLDFISPYAYLAFERLPAALEGLSVHVDYKPILFAGVLQHHGQLGPAEIPAKRDWTYRQALWLAREHNIPLDLPAAHPFNPLALLRLSLACASDSAAQAFGAGAISRHAAETVFRHVWRGGADAADAQRLESLTQTLAPLRDPSSAEVKRQLKANTEEAIAHGVFGVPSFVVDGRVFWGLDALPMLRASLEGDAWFGAGGWEAAGALPVGQARAGVVAEPKR
ncbi:MAG TPA: 2-hydroxychromene-2-carboxylate isomerase [Ramlibacter sp.]|nr:2-hydroxychromene-2-carboxylate isomerase [Ramlibacter sp.]